MSEKNGKRLLADVLWEAANEVLSPRDSYGWNGFSCCAVALAARANGAGDDYEKVLRHKALKFLARLGCVVDSMDSPFEESPFEEFPRGEVRQGVRHMWLLLAMHAAEDEQITV